MTARDGHITDKAAQVLGVILPNEGREGRGGAAGGLRDGGSYRRAGPGRGSRGAPRSMVEEEVRLKSNAMSLVSCLLLPLVSPFQLSGRYCSASDCPVDVLVRVQLFRDLIILSPLSPPRKRVITRLGKTCCTTVNGITMMRAACRAAAHVVVRTFTGVTS